MSELTHRAFPPTQPRSIKVPRAKQQSGSTVLKAPILENWYDFFFFFFGFSFISIEGDVTNTAANNNAISYVNVGLYLRQCRSIVHNRVGNLAKSPQYPHPMAFEVLQ